MNQNALKIVCLVNLILNVMYVKMDSTGLPVVRIVHRNALAVLQIWSVTPVNMAMLELTVVFAALAISNSARTQWLVVNALTFATPANPQLSVLNAITGIKTCVVVWLTVENASLHFMLSVILFCVCLVPNAARIVKMGFLVILVSLATPTLLLVPLAL